jgi:hypothetical protein
MNNYTVNDLEKEISEYFKGFFSAIEFLSRGNMVRMRAYRKQTDNYFEHLFNIEEINALAYSFHHRLENIKGDFVRAEQTIQLEKRQFASIADHIATKGPLGIVADDIAKKGPLGIVVNGINNINEL